MGLIHIVMENLMVMEAEEAVQNEAQASQLHVEPTQAQNGRISS